MLGQLLGAPVTQTTAKPLAQATEDSDTDADQCTQDAVAVTGLPIALNLPQSLTAEASTPQMDSLDLLGLKGGNGAPAQAAATLADAGTALLEAGNKEDGKTAGPNTPAHVLSADNTPATRAPSPADAAMGRPLQHQVGTSAWADELGSRMIMMSDRGQHSASLRLSPEHLGPLEVRISVRDDQASVFFGSANADTRAALEQALPRLRELFASQGMSLADAGVHHQASQGQHQSPSSFAGGTGTDAGAESISVSTAVAIKLGLVDAYA
jgi:flagellar hook-length control protein FliK